MLVVHTREGHRPDLADLPPAKHRRGNFATGIGDAGPDGPHPGARRSRATTSSRNLRPSPGEPVVDKPGKGAFYATDLEAMLRGRGIAQLIVCGVTTEVCVNTTVREANDRGFDCLVLADCTGSYFPEFQRDGPGDDQGAGRHFRLGRALGRAACSAGRTSTGQPTTVTTDRSTTMASARVASPAWWVPGDWNGFFGLFTNVVLNVIVLTGLCLGVVQLPGDIVFGRILPALGIALPLGNLFYAYLAYQLAQDAGARRCHGDALRAERAAYVHLSSS